MNNPHKSAPPRPTDPWDGLLLVDKPPGPTSHDIVASIRRHFGIRKVGHGGTLDPMAGGLLVILTGRGTRLSSHVMSSDKTYEGVMRLGVSTESQDADGAVIAERDSSQVTRAQLEREMQKWMGDVMQVPPMISAIKRQGVPLYKLARKGQVVEREPRFLHIYEFTLLDFTPPDASFRLRCTKGTYVRTLCADIGEALGCGAYLKTLRRTQSGPYHLRDAIPMDELMRMPRENVLARIHPMNEFKLHGTDA